MIKLGKMSWFDKIWFESMSIRDSMTTRSLCLICQIWSQRAHKDSDWPLLRDSTRKQTKCVFLCHIKEGNEGTKGKTKPKLLTFFFFSHFLYTRLFNIWCSIFQFPYMVLSSLMTDSPKVLKGITKGGKLLLCRLSGGHRKLCKFSPPNVGHACILLLYYRF